MGIFEDIVTVVDHIVNPEEYKDIGSKGERFTYRKLQKIFAKHQILRNVYLKKENDRYTEIDLFAVGRKGIYVFESKNYSGWIFGSEDNKTWTQSMPKGFKNQFSNPIFQNQGHIKALKNTLQQYPNLKYFSIIVFSERCELKDITVTSPDTYVIKRDMLEKTINKIIKEQPDIISIKEREDVINMLAKFQRPDEEIKEQHLNDLEDSFSKCPFCNSELIERTRKSDGNIFYGCKSYPKCKYTTKELKKIDS